MIFPNPAVITLTFLQVDEVTGAEFSESTVRYGANVEAQTVTGGVELMWDEDDYTRHVLMVEPKSMGIYIESAVSERETLKMRPMDPYDAVVLAPDVGIPQPIEVVEAHVLRGGGMLAPELDAVVAPDNTVVTLLIQTGMGAFVRYDGMWLRLPADSDALEDTTFVEVGPSALAVWDAGDSSGRTVTIADLPTKTRNAAQEVIEMPGEPEPTPEETVVTASGSTIPPVNQAEDLEMAVRFARSHPESRWYVVKRAKAMRMEHRIPQDWLLGPAAPENLPTFPSYSEQAEGVINPFEQATAATVAAARIYVQRCSAGDEPPPGVYASLIGHARRLGLLQHEAIVAAVDFQEWLHPRGKDGKFIEKFGLVNVFANPNSLPNDRSAPRRRAQVVDITPQGAKLEYVDALGNAKAPDPAAGYPEMIPTKEIGDKLSDAPRPLAILKNVIPENEEAQALGTKLVNRAFDSNAEAQKILDKAKADEPEISGLLRELSGVDGFGYDPSKIEGDNGQFYGTEFRLKALDSLTRKIATKGSYLPGGPQEAAGEIADALRYTLHYDQSNFSANAQRVIDGLRDRGYIVDVGNSWNNPNRAYKGVNADITSPNGQRFELQFHTPESQAAKDKQHVLYERQRKLPKRSPEWQRLEDQMFEISKPLARPADIETVAAVWPQ